MLPSGVRTNDPSDGPPFQQSLVFVTNLPACAGTTFQEPYPARTTVGVSLPGGILVEVEAVARKPA